MISQRERIIWIFAILISVISTFLVTSKSIVLPQRKNSNTAFVTPSADIEKEADQWFISSNSPMPRRDFYTELKSYDPLLIYQSAVESKETWINYPEQIAWRAFLPPPEIEGFVPTQISIYFYNTDIQSVLITLISRAGIGATENRTDFVKVHSVWKIVWAGQRSITLK